jgi:hypothetical protein
MSRRLIKLPAITLLLILPTFATFNYSIAQNATTPFKRFGIKAGINFSNINFNRGFPPPPTRTATVWKPGVIAGFILHVPINKSFSIQPEYQYSKVSGEDKSTGTIYGLKYLALPVLLKYEVLRKLSIEAGPEVSLLITGWKKLSGSSSSITHDTEERNFSISGGLEFEMFKNFHLSTRYISGISHISIRDGTTAREFSLYEFQVTGSISF